MMPVMADSGADGQRHPRLLLVDTNRWMVGARLAAMFLQLGCDVAMVCPAKGHPAENLKRLARRFPYRGVSPLASIRAAIRAFDPDLIVPVCDRGLGHLHRLHEWARESGDGRIAECIQRSLGPAESYAVVSSRYQLLRLAWEEKIPVPRTIEVRGIEDLHAWPESNPLPWVLKTDGSWGGQGVEVAESMEAAEPSFQKLTRRTGVLAWLAQISLTRDWGTQFSDWRSGRPSMIAQSWIAGRPANCAVVCWEGEVLAGISVEVMSSRGRTGPASVVEVVEGEEMLLAARRIAARLRLSGFFGLDFMIESETGTPYLIEMNPRCAPPCSLQLGKGRNLAAALYARMTSAREAETPSVTSKRRIAYYPQPGWSETKARAEEKLQDCYYDVPVDAPELIDALRRPWRSRTWVGQLADRIRGRRGRAVVEPPPRIEPEPKQNQGGA